MKKVKSIAVRGGVVLAGTIGIMVNETKSVSIVYWPSIGRCAKASLANPAFELVPSTHPDFMITDEERAAATNAYASYKQAINATAKRKRDAKKGVSVSEPDPITPLGSVATLMRPDLTEAELFEAYQGYRMIEQLFIGHIQRLTGDCSLAEFSLKVHFNEYERQRKVDDAKEKLNNLLAETGLSNEELIKILGDK